MVSRLLLKRSEYLVCLHVVAKVFKNVLVCLLCGC